MPSFVLASQGQPYMNAVTALASKTGEWLSVGDGLDVLSFDFDLALGAGNVTGSVTVEHSCQLIGTPSAGCRVLLPQGSLHTALSQAALSSLTAPAASVVLTAVVTGRFALHLGQIPAGNIRCNYVFASGSGASPNTVTCYASGWGRGR